MKQLLKSIIKKTPAYHPIRNLWFNRNQNKARIHWENNGNPVPPPHIIKQQTLTSYAKKYDLRILVETGTFYGDMIEAMKNKFDHIYSIELSDELHKYATKRFKRVKHVELIHGDSGVELKCVVDKIEQPALFWLDGHYSGGRTAKGNVISPIYEELDHIFNGPCKQHVIIIDDARLFGIEYPQIHDLIDFIKTKRPDAEIHIENDSIRIIQKIS